MFSAAEREYLRLVSEGPVEGVATRLSSVFPNPVYRRKLAWGIRRKAARSITDWTLYGAAATRMDGLLPPHGPTQTAAPPLYADSIVRLLEALRRRGPSRRTAPPGGRSSRGPRRD